jgi:hypothetical protein
MLALAVRAQQDLLTLDDAARPWRRAPDGIRLHPMAPVARHGPIVACGVAPGNSNTGPSVPYIAIIATHGTVGGLKRGERGRTEEGLQLRVQSVSGVDPKLAAEPKNGHVPALEQMQINLSRTRVGR